MHNRERFRSSTLSIPLQVPVADTRKKKIGIGNIRSHPPTRENEEAGKGEEHRKKEGGGCRRCHLISIVAPKGAVSRYLFAVQCYTEWLQKVELRK